MNKQTIGYNPDLAKIYDQIIYYYLLDNNDLESTYELFANLCCSNSGLTTWDRLAGLLKSLDLIKTSCIEPVDSFERQKLEESFYNLINNLTKVLAE